MDMNDKLEILNSNSRVAFMQGQYKEALNFAKNAMELDSKNADAVFPEFKDGEISHIIFTGGSSGTHKGVMLDNNGLNCVVRALDYVLPLNPEEKFMGNLPQFMAFGKMAMHYALCKSMQVDLTLKAMPQDFKDELFRLKPQGVLRGQYNGNILLMMFSKN